MSENHRLFLGPREARDMLRTEMPNANRINLNVRATILFFGLDRAKEEVVMSPNNVVSLAAERQLRRPISPASLSLVTEVEIVNPSTSMPYDWRQEDVRASQSDLSDQKTFEA